MEGFFGTVPPSRAPRRARRGPPETCPERRAPRRAPVWDPRRAPTRAPRCALTRALRCALTSAPRRAPTRAPTRSPGCAPGETRGVPKMCSVTCSDTCSKSCSKTSSYLRVSQDVCSREAVEIVRCTANYLSQRVAEGPARITRDRHTVSRLDRQTVDDATCKSACGKTLQLQAIHSRAHFCVVSACEG